MKCDERVCKILKLFLELTFFLIQGTIFNKTVWSYAVKGTNSIDTTVNFN